jgi:hypothetical protein
MSASENQDTPILNELRKISKLLMLVHSGAIETEIEKIAHSESRKKMWVLIDGKRMPKDIAKEAKVTSMAVSYFLDSASAAGFVQYTQREPPKKILDYMPPSWIALVITEQEVEPTKNKETVDSKASATTIEPCQNKQSEGTSNE